MVPAVNASTNGGLTLSPPLKEITLNSGIIQANTSVTLTNTTGSTVNVTFQLVDLKTLGQYGGNTLDRAGLPDSYDLANWMSIKGDSTRKIANGESATTNIVIDNRADLSPGGHYGAIIITTSAENDSGRSVSLKQQLISLIFVKKLGGEVYGLDLESLNPNQAAKMPERVDLLFRGTGNVHVKPRGYVEVTDPKGKLIAKGIINPDSSIVLPGASRNIDTILQPVAAPRVKGEYKIAAYYRYDDQKDFSSKSITFTHSPNSNPLLYASGTILILLFAGISRWMYYRKQRMNSKNKHRITNSL